MTGELFGEGQLLAYQTGNALPQRIVEALDRVRFTHYFADRSMRRRGNHPCVYHALIGVKRGMLTVRLRNLRPQALGTLPDPIPQVKSHHLVGLGIHGHPSPLLVGFLLREAAQFIGFHLRASYQDIAVTGDRLDLQILRQRLEALD